MSENIRNTDLIVVIDKGGKILYYNNFNDKINKLNDSETVGKHISDVYHWVNKDTPLFKVMEEKAPILNQVFNITIDNKNVVRAINSAYPLIGPDGVIGSIGFSTATKKDMDKSRNTQLLSAKYEFEDIVTRSERLIEIKEKLNNVAKYNSNIFIFGESGTGKELFAHSIHNASYRVNKPFIVQNCGAIPENLMESTFFGTVEGAFTGSKDKRGVFDMAEGGTLFLDEIDSLPLELQPKLLRVLEEGFFRRVGGTEDIKTDVRIITATNLSVKELTEDKMRKDLFFRLGVINVKIPPLRNRCEDIPLLIEHFKGNYNTLFDKKVKGFNKEVLEIFNSYNWPGNVRELRNVLESAFINVRGDFITKEDLPERILDIENREKGVLGKESLSNLVESYEEELIREALVYNKYNIVRTAEYLKMPRQTLYYKLNKYGLN